MLNSSLVLHGGGHDMNDKDEIRPRIRLFQDSDYDAVAALWRSVKLTRQDGTVESIDELRTIKERNPSTVLVAEVENRVVGTIVGTFDGRRGFISRLGIDPGIQHHGLGSMLFKELITRFRSLGVSRVIGFVTKENAGVLDFYKKFGAEIMEDVIPVRLKL
jgi:ribosomal protein S18 acetylase RimI-like enzyme